MLFLGAFLEKTLTRLTWLIHTSFLLSNWNLDKLFALTSDLGQLHMTKKNFRFSSIWEDGYFCYWICDFPPSYIVKWIRGKWLPHGAISKIFFVDHFTIIFMTKIVTLHRYRFRFEGKKDVWIGQVRRVKSSVQYS